MNPALAMRLLVAIGLIAALAIAAEVAFGPDGTIATEVVQAGKPATLAPAQPRPIRENHVEQSVSTLLARPLFSPTRRPDPVAETAGGALTAGGDELPRLAGIILSSGMKLAIFQRGDNSKPIVGSEGKVISGWTVKSISGDKVTMSGPHGTRTLEPQLDRSAAAPAPGLPGAALAPAAQPTLGAHIAAPALAPPPANPLLGNLAGAPAATTGTTINFIHGPGPEGD